MVFEEEDHLGLLAGEQLIDTPLLEFQSIGIREWFEDLLDERHGR